MKHYLIFILSVFILSTSTYAQSGNPERHQQMEALNAEYLTKNLNLNTQEAQSFWPVYNNYRREMNNLFRSRHEARKQAKEQGTPGSVDGLKFETLILDTKKRYLKQFYEVLPKAKADLVYPTEREFREHLINQLKERREKRD
ncbi:hypothetical protein [Arcticibacter eurypsychrophilus]|uniref:hypothetical protein n=1 Tax=Arcticibacter eurypsychrophilus TaxID=1434752 RepID=UPI00084D82BF|nr:hypothetical protein [Arcticibacter eurypsychrophilus]